MIYKSKKLNNQVQEALQWSTGVTLEPWVSSSNILSSYNFSACLTYIIYLNISMTYSENTPN